MIAEYKKSRKQRLTLCVCMLFLALAGCGTSPPTSSVTPELAPVALRVNLEQSSQLDTIAYLVLTVTASDMDTIQQTIFVHNSSFEDSLFVPAGGEQRLFVLDAKSTEGKILYSGSTSVQLVGGTTAIVEINLVPAVLMIKLTPRFREVPESEEFNLDVEVYNVESLFGASFRIEFDDNLLECRDAVSPSEQEIMGPSSSFIFFDTTGTDYVAVTITKMFPAAPASGSGGLAQLSFRALSAGTASLTFSSPTLRLIKADGSDIPNRESLVVDQAVVEIVSSTNPDDSESLWIATVDYYPETADLDSIVAALYGDNYRVADWNDLVAYSSTHSMVEWADEMGMLNGYPNGFLVTNGGNHFWSGSRHYWIDRHDHVVPANWLPLGPHATIDDHFIDLGSWYNMSLRILCIRIN